MQPGKARSPTTSKNKRQIVDVGNAVRAATIQSVKGIAFPHVVVFGVNQLTAGAGSDETDLRRLAYVAMTRATHGGSSPR